MPEKMQQKICRIEEAHCHIEDGWRLVNTYTSTRTDVVPLRDPHGCGYQPDVPVVANVVEDRWVLLERDADELLGELKEELRKLRDENVAALIAREGAEAASEAAAKEVKTLKENQAKLAELRDACLSRCDRERDGRRKAETDLAKLRSHVGRKVYEEALNRDE